MVGNIEIINGNIESLLTLQQACRLLNVHPNTLRRWSDNGLIKAYRIGPRGDRRFNPEEVDNFLKDYNLSGSG